MPTTLAPRSQSTLAGLACSITARLAAGPPVAITTTIGVSTSAKIISVACTVSVQLTARKPPTIV